MQKETGYENYLVFPYRIIYKLHLTSVFLSSLVLEIGWSVESRFLSFSGIYGKSCGPRIPDDIQGVPHK